MGRLASEGHGLTLLAPTDDAMARAGLVTDGGAWRSPSPPDDVLRAHLLRGFNTEETFSLSVRRYGAATYATLRAPLTVTAHAGGSASSVPVVFFGQGYVSAANLSDPDVYTYGNISIQGIDGVLFRRRHLAESPLLPADADDAEPTPGADAGRSSFTPAAYPVKWSVRPSPPVRSSFTPAAYPVKWSVRPNPPVRSSFTPAAYPVKWSVRPSPPLVARGQAGSLHVEPGMLFPRKTLFPGATLPEGTKFAGGGFPAPPRFTFRAGADAIPFSYDRLDTILRTFGIPRGSKKANQVAATLRTCEATASPAEPHTCAASQQAMAEFAASSLGTRPSELRAVATAVHGEDEPARYMVAQAGAARIGGSNAGGDAAVVVCHPMAYPYMVHYCHLPADVEALRVELTGLGDGDGASATATTTTAVAICHADTTSWDARYFKMLNATRGEEICHFMPLSYVLWLPAAAL
ncbi:hypothetical protein U9M48_011759 [Paspalum notatum var. saurae]|uniref:BURP domain-containing protein n=1 Tax=Paspalum notatum var. saurae TaxID=547442 RepID=A0AAQ3SWY5_PASNO